MAAESYSAWFLRFLSTFWNTVDKPVTPDQSHTRWFEVFADSFTSERAAIAKDEQARETEAAEAEAPWKVWEETSEAQLEAESPQTRHVEESREQPRYRTMGDEG